MQKIVIDISGWVSLDPAEVQFIRFDEPEETIINGEEYLSLSQEERDGFVLLDVVQCLRDSTDGDLEISFNLQEEPA